MKSPKDSVSQQDTPPFPWNHLKNGLKENDGEKRSYSRQYLSAQLEIFHINMQKCSDAQLINQGQGGICINSITKFNPGMSLFIRVTNFPSKDSHDELSKVIRSMTFADVKWCQEIRDFGRPFFKMGLQFYAPAY